MNLDDEIGWEDGSDNTAGIQQAIYMCKMADVATLPKPTLDDSTGSGNLSDLVTISGNIIMKAGKYMTKVYVTLETGGLKSETQGDLDGKSFKNTLTFFRPGSQAEMLGLAQWSKNSSMLILIPEADGQVRMLGHEGYPAKLDKSPLDTGTKTSDRKGGEFTFYSVRKGPAPVFTGKVVLTGSAAGSGLFDANSNSYQDIYFIAGS